MCATTMEPPLRAKRGWSDRAAPIAGLGGSLITASIVIGLLLWIGSKAARADWFTIPTLYLSKTCALSGMLTMSWTMLLSARWRCWEWLFGGQDKVYIWHRRLGIASGALFTLHPIFLALPRLPQLTQFASFFILPFPHPGSLYEIGANLGACAWVLMVLLLVAARLPIAPYRRWLSLHRWMGAVFWLGALHILILERDISLYPLLQVWMWGWILAGLTAWAYMRCYHWLAPHSTYTLHTLEHHGALLTLRASPSGEPLTYRPGQWVMLECPSLGVRGERHPLSLVSDPVSGEELVFGVRIVGPWTQSLLHLHKGCPLQVYGPYGSLGDHFLRGDHNVVCIGGGIGITPFISLWGTALHTPEAMPPRPAGPPRDLSPEGLLEWNSPCVQLIYLVKDLGEAIFDPMIRQVALTSRFRGLEHAATRGHHYLLRVSPPSAPLSIEELGKQVGGLAGKRILLCGPSQMIHAYQEELLLLGVPRELIAWEEFDWRGR